MTPDVIKGHKTTITNITGSILDEMLFISPWDLCYSVLKVCHQSKTNVTIWLYSNIDHLSSAQLLLLKDLTDKCLISWCTRCCLDGPTIKANIVLINIAYTIFIFVTLQMLVTIKLVIELPFPRLGIKIQVDRL